MKLIYQSRFYDWDRIINANSIRSADWGKMQCVYVMGLFPIALQSYSTHVWNNVFDMSVCKRVKTRHHSEQKEKETISINMKYKLFF